MLNRPKNTDTMDDVLDMQKKYLEEKDKKFKPAAHVVSKNKKAGKSSLFAKQRNIERKASSDSNKVCIISDIVERKYDPKNLSELSNDNSHKMDCGFPEVLNIDQEEDSQSNESLFSTIMKKTNNSQKSTDDIKKGIDEENTAVLKSMSAQEILKEREELLKAMDPNLVKFLMDKRKGNVEEAQSTTLKENVKSQDIDYKLYIDDLPTNEILEEAGLFNYVNMNIVEPEKLEWLKDAEKIQTIPKDKKYEARFDLKGYLLPYTFDEKIGLDDNRELFCHEKESHRPGYTLQELFRLARAEMLQQRVASISAISGIINIYMQGFYDGILELPISKIFFFLRFGLDENIPAIIEVCSKSLAYLFYNEADEALLDMIFETNSGLIQPSLNSEKMQNKGIEEAFQKLSLDEHNENIFESNITDDIISSSDDREKESMTDFHLAEVNLTECLERTNILERISYILTVMHSNQNTNISCLKLLIRLTRCSESFSNGILKKRNLMDYLLSEQNLSKERSEESSLIIKLFRIIASYSYNNLLQLVQQSTLFEKLVALVSSQSDMNAKCIKLQIEAFRFLRLYFRTKHDEGNFSSILFPLRYLLEWHLHNLDFHNKNHFICRIHASALLYLIQCSNVKVTYSLFGETFKMCCKKWYQRASIDSMQDLSQKILLSSVLDVATDFINFIPEFFYDFVSEYLIKFFKSTSYKDVLKSLKLSSPLLNDFYDRSSINKPLFNFGSIVRTSRYSRDVPRLIYSQNYSAYFINSLLAFISLFRDDRNKMNIKIYHKLKELFFMDDIEKYLESIASLDKRPLICSNWFVQIELKLIYNLLKTKHYRYSWTFKIAYNLLQNLTSDKFVLILDIFDSFIFHDEFSNGLIDKEDLERMKYIYNGLVMSKVKEIKQGCIAMTQKWNEHLLDDTWPYEFLLIFLHNISINTTDEKQIVETDLSEEEIITTTLKLKCFLSSKQVQTLSTDEQLMYLMLIYFGNDLCFLNQAVKDMIILELDTLRGKSFSFNIKLNNEKDFESLYKLFLETFQAESYADNIFSSFVMIPLIQKYNVKWRNIVWSEYAMILKFITCEENDLLYDFNEYLYPIETNEMLLKAYQVSLKYLRKESLPWKIAVHHLNHNGFI